LEDAMAMVPSCHILDRMCASLSVSFSFFLHDRQLLCIIINIICQSNEQLSESYTILSDEQSLGEIFSGKHAITVAIAIDITIAKKR
jgi:hypothetical protein